MLPESIIVSDRSKSRSIGVQRDGREGTALTLKATCEFRRDVPRVGRRSPVPRDQKPAAGSQSRIDEINSL
jgi:hypothetical protein